MNTFGWSGFAYSCTFDAPLFVLFNNFSGESDNRVFVHKIVCRPLQVVQSVPGTLKVARIGGINIPQGDSVSIVPADTSSPPFPSSIRVLSNVNAPNTSLIFGARQNFQFPNTFPTKRGSEYLWMETNYDFHFTRGEGSVEPIRAREGESVYYIHSTLTESHPSGLFMVNALIRIGTDYYYVVSDFHPINQNFSPLMINNSLGSGLVVDILFVSLVECVDGSAVTSHLTNTPYFLIKRIESFDGGEPVDPVPYSTVLSLPAQIQLRRSRLFNPISHADREWPQRDQLGYPASNKVLIESVHAFRRVMLNISNVMQPNLAALPFSEMQSTVNVFDVNTSLNDVSSIVLHPTEGLAITSSNVGMYSAAYIEVEFSYKQSINLKSLVFVT